MEISLRNPTHYTSSEGGSWEPWVAGPLEAAHLQIMVNPAKLSKVLMNGIVVHSLAVIVDDQLVLRWDCISGQTRV